MLAPWLTPILDGVLANRVRMPHALLLYGQAGIGKRSLAVAIARSLLCEAVDVSRRSGGCGACDACLWFDQHNHPDFRMVTTEALALAAGQDEAEGEGEGADERDDTPARGKRAPSKEIRFAQVAALQSFLSVATHRGGNRIVVIHPAETLNPTAANMLLKVLEEPPASTVFLLVTDRMDALPPTIVSRCRKLPIATPLDDITRRWLGDQQQEGAGELLAAAGGAPFAAIAMAADDEWVTSRRRLVEHLARPDVQGALALAESLARSPLVPIVTSMQQWIADCIAMRLAGRVRYHPAQAEAIESLAAKARIAALFAMQRRLESIRRSAEHPLNVRMVLEGMLMAYVETMQAAAR